MGAALVASPLSNDALRDWPLGHWAALIGLCVERLDAEVSLVGARAQRLAVGMMAAGLRPGRVRNLCGGTSWAEAEALVAAADCVIANNSGIAHLAARLGVPTVCVFAASHSPLEWMPRGPRVITLFKRTACSPCDLGRAEDCLFGQRCLTGITPATVFEAVARSVAAGPASERAL